VIAVRAINMPEIRRTLGHTAGGIGCIAHARSCGPHRQTST
jgi:hypothetical protein